MVTILYDNQDVFSGVCPTPLVGITSNNLHFGGKRWGNTKTVTLNGTITGICNDFSDLINKQRTLLSGFQRDFRNLIIDEDGSTVYSQSFVTVASISFPNSRYVKVLPFIVTLNCFDSGEFWNYYGVTNPKREITVQEAANGEVNVSYEVSADGFNTDSTYNSIDNAIAFVDSLTGIPYIDVDLFSGYLGKEIPTPFCRINLEKNFDKINGRYSVRQNYLYTAMDSGVRSYSMTFSSNRYGPYDITGLKGEIIGCEDQDISGLRAIVPTGIPGATGNVYKYNIQEDGKNKKISFDIEVGNDPEDDVYFEYDVNTKIDVIKGFGTVSLNGAVKAKRGNREERLAKVLAFGVDEFVCSGICVTGYMEAGGLYPQYLRETEYAKIIDPDAGEVRVTFAMSDRQFYAEYSISLSPAMPYYVVNTTCDSRVVVQDYNIYTNGTIGITATVPSGDTFDIGTLYPTGYRILESFSGINTLGVFNFKQTFATYDYKFFKNGDS